MTYRGKRLCSYRPPHTLAVVWSIRLCLSVRWMLWTFKGGAPRPSMAAGLISRHFTANRWYSALAKLSDYDHRHMQNKRITLFMCFPTWYALLCHPPAVFIVVHDTWHIGRPKPKQHYEPLLGSMSLQYVEMWPKKTSNISMNINNHFFLAWFHHTHFGKWHLKNTQIQ